MSYRIIADSSCDLPENYLADTDIALSTVPLKIIIDGKEFVDDGELDTKTLLNAMRLGKHMSTACPSPEEFAEEFRKDEHSICVTMTSALSGTHNSAKSAEGIVKEEMPEAKVEVVDSLLTSGAMALMVMRLRDLVSQGLDYEAIVAKIREYQKTLCVRFVLQDLSNLVKTGRLSVVAGVFASALSLCPIMGDNGKGEIVVMEKVRGAKQAMSKLVDSVAEKFKSCKEFPVVISHCDNEAQATSVKDMLAERFGLNDVHILPMRGLASFYANQKGIIMAF